VEDSYAVIVTAGHDTDYAVLKNVLKKPFYYIGVICSRRKKKILLEKLAQEGFSEEIITKIHTPIGLDIGSETPEEIAVSIVAELIKVKNLEKNN
jgi:xanthine dehydrogenase accessory factor